MIFKRGMLRPDCPVAVSVILGVLCAAPSGAVDWPHFGYDDQYTSYCPASTQINISNVSRLQRRWGISCDDGYFFSVFGSPALYAGALYLSGAGEPLHALNASDGAQKWEFGQGNSGWAPQPAVSSDGVIFYLEGVLPTNLYAVNRSGKQIWKAPISFDYGFEEAVQAVPTIDEAKKVVYVIENPFGPEGGRLFALSKGSGKVIWYKSKAKDGIAFRGRYVLLKGSTIFANALIPDAQSSWGDETVVRINPTTKKIEIKYQRPASGSSLQVSHYSLCNDILLVEYSDRDLSDPTWKGTSILAAYNVNAAGILWQKDLSKMPIAGAIACNTKKKRIYVPTDPYLYAFNAGNGQQLWRYTAYAPVHSPSVANGVIYFTSDTNVYALNETTGKRLLSYDLGYTSDFSTQVAIGSDAIYLSGSGGTCDFVALSPPTATDEQP
ncbi:MAG: PQQ-binding-like beta-propeller repeat protein [Acidobacteria bacterium]|nr:PQQ-binding-like beta-propeller repeat protein [Acidobacteriota bacterium]